jgi:hypothetical protein
MKIQSYSQPQVAGTETNGPASKSLVRNESAAAALGSDAQTYFDRSSTPASTQSPAIQAGDLDQIIDEIDAGSAEAMDPRKFMEFMKGLGEEERGELRDFHKKVFEAAQGGELDEATLSSLAAEAPEALVRFAEENGLSVEDVIKSGLERAKHRPPGPPRDGIHGELHSFLESQGMDEAGRREIGDFMRTLMENSRDGTLDLSALEAQAPAALNSFAESKGVSLSELLQQLVDGAPKPGGPAPESE